MDTNRQADPLQAAAAWYARLAAPDCSAQEQAEFERWLNSDVSHQRAFASVARAANAFSAADARLTAMADEAFAQAGASVSGSSAKPARKRWVTVPLALAASVLVAVGVIRLAPELQNRSTPRVSYETAPGQTRALQLSDGSTVQLDVATKIEVQMRADERRITLNTGRAYFKVAHDTLRPFVVTAHGVRTVAVGTEFQVQHDAESTLVTLTEGSVLVSDASATEPRWEERLVPGDQVRMATGASAPERHTVNPLAATSWLQRRHVFDHTPLDEAIAEVNRYSDRKLRLGDPSLAQLQIGGSFAAGDGELIAASIAAALPITIMEAGPKEIILFPRHN